MPARKTSSKGKGTKRKSATGPPPTESKTSTKRFKVDCSAQLMDILDFERPILSGKVYEGPAEETVFPKPVETLGWEFLLENVQLSSGDFETKLDKMIKTTDLIGEMEEDLREQFEDSLLTNHKLATKKLLALQHSAPPSSLKASAAETPSKSPYSLRKRKSKANGSASKAVSNGKVKAKSKKKGGETELDSEIIYEFGGPVGAFMIMAWSHCMMYYLWLSVEKHNGGLFVPSGLDLWHIYNECTPSLRIAGIYLVFIALQYVLGRWLPGLIMEGLPIPSENYTVLKYNCNGFSAWWVTLIIVGALEYFQIFSIATLADNYGQLMTVMVIFGDFMALSVYVSGFLLKKTIRMTGNHVYDFFMGSYLNPRIGPLDLKLWAEVRVSWFTLYLLTLSCWVKNYEQVGGDLSKIHPGLYVMVIAHWLYTNACVKGEECIVTTWDIFYEKWGWMLIFWNFAGVPIVYTWNSFYILKIQPDLPARCGIYLTICLLITYYIWDTTNSQKNRFRMQMHKTFKPRPWYVFPQLPWGTLKDPIAIKTKRGTRLLVSGWYGLSKTRKIHYLMDILFALEWGLAAGCQNFLPYFYLIFFTSFIMHRGIRDNERCERKYGKDWERYCALVPYMLIPGVW